MLRTLAAYAASRRRGPHRERLARLYIAREARHTAGMSRAHDIDAVIASLGGPATDPIADFLVDPGAACRALDERDEHDGLVVRVAPELATPRGTSHGPVPAAPRWARITRGAREIGLARGGEDVWVRRATEVVVEEHDEPCCEAPGCDKKRRHAGAWLVLEPIPEQGAETRLLVYEQRWLGDARPDAHLAVAARLATALGVPLRRGGEELDPTPPPAPAPVAEALPRDDLARFALRSEGDRVIVRDWQSAGPRASAARNAWIGGALLVVAALGWFELWRSVEAHATSAAIAAGVVGALFTLAGYAFVGVARFSARYRAPCAPLVAVGRDRLVVLPWVGRDGAVDARPEGRLGAAIPLGEVRASRTRPRGRGVAVELDTDHGPIDALVCASAGSAELWAKAIDRIIDEARHPQKGASARQRARKAERGGNRPAPELGGERPAT